MRLPVAHRLLCCRDYVCTRVTHTISQPGLNVMLPLLSRLEFCCDCRSQCPVMVCPCFVSAPNVWATLLMLCLANPLPLPGRPPAPSVQQRCSVWAPCRRSPACGAQVCPHSCTTKTCPEPWSLDPLLPPPLPLTYASHCPRSTVHRGKRPSPPTDPSHCFFWCGTAHRQATVKAVSTLVVLTLDRNTFIGIIGPLQEFMAKEKSAEVGATSQAVGCRHRGVAARVRS